MRNRSGDDVEMGRQSHPEMLRIIIQQWKPGQNTIGVRGSSEVASYSYPSDLVQVDKFLETNVSNGTADE